MKAKKPLLIALALGAAFAWGALSARREIFPFPQVKSAWASVRGVFREEKKRIEPSNWNVVRVRDLPDNVAELSQLPYVGAHKPGSDLVGVTAFDSDSAQLGINLVVSGDAPTATLIDMDGNEIHRWTKRFDEVWTEPLAFEEFEVHKTFWRRAHVFPNGDLLAIFEGIGMIKLDIDSNLIWANQCRSHHDLFVDEEGQIYTVARSWRDDYPTCEGHEKYLEDFIVVLSPDGEEIERVSIVQALLDSDYASLLTMVPGTRDPLHTNTLEVLDGRHAAKYPMLQKGHVLLSLPAVDAVVIVDPEVPVVTWALAGMFGFQHQPTILDNGRMMVFDNLGGKLDDNAAAVGMSRVLEIDPLSQQVVWKYRGEELAPFESRALGSCQRLANGNTLVTESTAGRAFEARPDGKIAWEYYNPARGGDDGELIAYLMEVVRLDIDPFVGAFPQLGQPKKKLDSGTLRDLQRRQGM